MPNGPDMLQGIPLQAGAWRYTPRFIEALRVVATIHADGVRKQTTIPYAHRALVDAYRKNAAHMPALIDELDKTVTEMERLASAASSEVIPDRG